MRFEANTLITKNLKLVSLEVDFELPSSPGSVLYRYHPLTSDARNKFATIRITLATGIGVAKVPVQ